MQTIETYSRLADVTIEDDQHHAFADCADEKGRAIGLMIRRRTEVLEEIDAPVPGESFYRMEGGAWYLWNPHTTRNGRRWGATQYWRYCRTAEEREAEIAEYLAKAQKKATK